jgi:hypothetical protein
MPFIDIHGAHIHYESFRPDRSDQVPIVLIHGSARAVYHAAHPSRSASSYAGGVYHPC